MEQLGQLQQLLPFALLQPGNGDARPTADNPGDFFFGDFIPQQTAFAPVAVGDLFFLLQFLLQFRQLAVFQLGRLAQIVVPFGLGDLGVGAFNVLAQLLHLLNGGFLVLPAGFHFLHLFPLLAQLFLQHFQTALAGFVILFLQGVFLDFQLHDPAADLVQLRRHGVDLGTDHGTGLVHQVDGLIRQETVGDITVGQRSGGNQRAVGDLYAMEDFIALLQAAQDGNRILYRRLSDQHRLEAPFQRRVLFDVLAVFVQRGRADQVQLAPGQHGLEQVARVHGAFGFARAHDGVQFIDKEQDLAFALGDFLQHGLQTFLKFTPVLGAGDQAAHIQAENGAVFQAVRHVAPDNSLGQPLGNGGFTNAGLADQHRVVLGFPGQNPNDAADLVIPANDRVQLLVPGGGGQVGAVFGQRVIGVLRGLAGNAAVAPHALQNRQEGVEGNGVAVPQLLHGAGGLFQQAHEQMLHAHVLVLHLLRPFLGGDQRPVYIIGNINFIGFPAGTRHLGDAGDHGLQAGKNLLRVFAHFGQKLRNEALRVAEQGAGQMLLRHFLILIFHRQLLGVLQRLPAFFGKLVVVHMLDPLGADGLWWIRAPMVAEIFGRSFGQSYF